MVGQNTTRRHAIQASAYVLQSRLFRYGQHPGGQVLVVYQVTRVFLIAMTLIHPLGHGDAIIERLVSIVQFSMGKRPGGSYLTLNPVIVCCRNGELRKCL